MAHVSSLLSHMAMPSCKKGCVGSSLTGWPQTLLNYESERKGEWFEGQPASCQREMRVVSFSMRTLWLGEVKRSHRKTAEEPGIASGLPDPGAASEGPGGHGLSAVFTEHAAAALRRFVIREGPGSPPNLPRRSKQTPLFSYFSYNMIFIDPNIFLYTLV